MLQTNNIMTKNYFSLPLFALLLANLQANAQACLPTFQYGADSNMITNVQFANINNTSPFTSGTTNVYEDFTAQSATFNAGDSFPISIKGPSSTFPSDVMVYVDFNQNGSFSDQGEGFYAGRITPANPANAATITTTINIPASALAGSTKLRIVKNTNIAALSDNSAPNSISGPCATDLRAGQTEDYSLFITATAQTCADPGNMPGDLGCVTFNYRSVQTTLTTVRGADGKIWLQQNLGSDAVATSATDENAYGDMFQWGRWDDGHQLRASQTSNVAPQPNNPTGLDGSNGTFLTGSAEWWKTGTIADKWEAASVADVMAQNGCDPCKALGEGWSLPSQADWTNAIASEAITTLPKAFESNLKLTLGGSRTSSGTFNFVGVRGYYWSNTTTTTTGYGKHLYYSAAIINPSSGSYRELGMSIRCLKSGAVLGTGEFLKANFKLYPNPTSSIVTIETDAEINEVLVYNQIGQLVLKSGAKTFDLSGQASGIYLVQTHFADGTTKTDKIVKN